MNYVSHLISKNMYMSVRNQEMNEYLMSFIMSKKIKIKKFLNSPKIEPDGLNEQPTKRGGGIFRIKKKDRFLMKKVLNFNTVISISI